MNEMSMIEYIQHHKKGEWNYLKDIVVNRKLKLFELYNTAEIYRVMFEKESNPNVRIVVSVVKKFEKYIIEILVNHNKNIVSESFILSKWQYWKFFVQISLLNIWNLKSRFKGYMGVPNFYVFEFYFLKKHNFVILEQDKQDKKSCFKIIRIYKKMVLQFTKNEEILRLIKRF